MKKLSPIVTRSAIVIGLVLGAFGISALADWTAAPPSGPPGCASGYAGCDAPINVAYGSQHKYGGLLIDSKLTSGTTPSDYTTYGIWVTGKPVKAEGGLIIQVCSTASANCPESGGATPENGQMWVETP